MLAPILASITPFILWPIELVFPYPHVVEELSKGVISYLIIRSKTKNPILAAVASGVLFGVSETVFYLFNILPSGNSSTLALRLVTTLPMHVITFVIITVISLKNKYFMPLAVTLTILIHYLFNRSVF